jgi:hypothetical protein
MTFKEYILHQLREMRRELLTATEDLDENDLISFDPAGHWPIAWITEHCTEVADRYLYGPVHGSMQHTYEAHVGNWRNQEPKPGDQYPNILGLRNRWKMVCDSVIDIVEAADEDELQKTYGKEPYINSLLRVINHTNSHLRSLWCILGERRVDEKWAEQQNFLA